jgi:small subunit ribosomal protein S6
MNRHYELVLMLDPEAADEAREKLAGDVRQAIEGAGTLDRADTWGVRKMAYEIKQRNEADYRFYRFQGEPPLLERLDHSLKIADGVLRFRIFKVDPRTPVIIPPSPAPTSSAAPRAEREEAAPPAAEAPAAPPAPEAAPPAEAPAPAVEAEAPPTAEEEPAPPADEAPEPAAGDAADGEPAAE